MAVISISINVSKIHSANQRALYDYADHVSVKHNTDKSKSIRRIIGLVLIAAVLTNGQASYAHAWVASGFQALFSQKSIPNLFAWEFHPLQGVEKQ